MKTNKDYKLREIVGENVLVPTGKAAMEVNGMIHLSETGVFLWKLYDVKDNLEELVTALMDEFEVEEEIARRDVYNFSQMLLENHMIQEVPELA